MSENFLFRSLVQPLINMVVVIGQMGFFFLKFLHSLIGLPYVFEELILHTYRICFRCLLPVLGVVTPMGMIISMQGLAILSIFSAQPLLSSLLVISMLRELTPAMTAIMIAAQAGSSIAAELGAMRNREEIDAQEVMSVNPIQFLVVPRLLAVIIAAPVLTAIANFFGIAGGWVIGVPIKGINHGVFMANLLDFVNIEDIFSGILKATIFGAIIGVVSCFRGYYARGGAAGVGRAANKAVVESIIALFVVNYFLSSAIYSVTEKIN